MNIDQTVVAAYLDAMRNYAVFKGRTSHSDFLWAQWVFLPIVAISFGLFGVPLIFGDVVGLGRFSDWPLLFDVFVVLPHVVPWAALMVRRLHDLDQPGAWALLALIPIGLVLPFPMAGLVIWGTRPGTQGPNRFGPDPLGREPQSAVTAAGVAYGAHVSGPSLVAHQPRDVIGELERLAQLRASGALSETEFEVMKAQTLGDGRA
jgi:uncharacterized membrane protein YhaH (DUF805 family)